MIRLVFLLSTLSLLVIADENANDVVDDNSVKAEAGENEGDNNVQDWSDADQENEENSLDCPEGSIMLQGEHCGKCNPGQFYNENILDCEACPLDSYNSDPLRTSCAPCPDSLQTTYTSSPTEDYCMHVCEIPRPKEGYFQKMDGIGTSRLKESDRVMFGDEISFSCFEEESSISGYSADISVINVMCTEQTAGQIPSLCLEAEGALDFGNGLICYSNCYQETYQQLDRFVMYVEGNEVATESCPLIECEGAENTMCVSVAVEIGDDTHVKTHYDCGSPAISDDDICTPFGATGCAVERCTEQRCNEPVVFEKEKKKGESGASTLFSSPLVLMLSLLITVFLQVVVARDIMY